MGDRLTTAAAYTASGGTTFIGALTANEVGIVAGIVLGVATFCVNWYYKHRMLKIHERLAEGNRRAEQGDGA